MAVKSDQFLPGWIFQQKQESALFLLGLCVAMWWCALAARGCALLSLGLARPLLGRGGSAGACAGGCLRCAPAALMASHEYTMVCNIKLVH